MSQVNHATTIADAVEPFKAASIAEAKDSAERRIERLYTDLSAHNWDINAAFPYPYGGANRMSRNEYEMAKARRAFAESVTVRDESKPSGYRISDPYFVVRDDARMADFIRIAEMDAICQFDNFIVKLEGKVSAVAPIETVQFDMAASPWSNSTLTVNHVGGEISVWRTKQIINVSKLGRLYNQWPTNRMKV